MQSLDFGYFVQTKPWVHFFDKSEVMVNCEGLIRPVKMIGGGVPLSGIRAWILRRRSPHYQLSAQPLQEPKNYIFKMRIVE